MKENFKSRTGCSSCRSRRVKCDEGKPECLNCQKRGIKCPGYARNLKWLHYTDKGGSISPAGSPPRVNEGFQSKQRSQKAVSSFAATSKSRHGSAVTPTCETSPSNVGLESRDLVEYYFSHVCRIISAFDGSKNPFRTTLSKIWCKSPLICSSMRALAAGDLTRLGDLSLEQSLHLQRDAFKELRIKLQAEDAELMPNQDESLLALIMLGPMTSWYSPDDLGIAHYRIAVSLLRQRLDSTVEGDGGAVDRTNKFFSEALLYWWMLTSFASTIDIPLPPLLESDSHRFPHPWTGVSPEARLLLGQVGRLLLAQRTRSLKSGFLTRREVQLDLDALSEAGALEGKLLSLEIPTTNQIVDSDDPGAPCSDFIRTAEAFRCAGFLLLYRGFPDLLETRLCGIDKDDFTTFYLYKEDIDRLRDAQRWLTALAIYTLELLEGAEGSHNLQTLQPILLLVIAGELKLPSRDDGAVHGDRCVDSELSSYIRTLLELDSEATPNIVTGANMQAVSDARVRLKRRIDLAASILPTSTASRLQNIVNETHRRMDDGHSDCFWVDVMVQNGWSAIFG